MRKIIKSILLIVILVLVLTTITLQALSFWEVNPSIESEYVHAIKNKLYDQNNEELVLKETNIGNFLVPEGWIGIIEIAGQDDEIDGKKLTYKKLISSMNNNPNLSDHQIDELMNIYYENFFSEDDVLFIKSQGFNCIRLPFAYFNIYNEDFTIKENGFYWIDKCVEWCTTNEMYIVLDCHGAFGSQNREHHSGDDTQCILFDDQESQTKTIKMWEAIARRYKDCKWVAGYDLLNEPTGTKGRTTKNQWDFYDKLYDAIRTIDENHLLIMESCWTFSNLPNPLFYGWTNIMYEFHFYNPNTAVISMRVYITYQKVAHKLSQFKNVPIYIGEFALGDSYEDLERLLSTFDKLGWSWTTWCYKTNDSWNWGKLCLWKDRVMVNTATYSTIKESFEGVKSNFENQSDGFKNIKRYLNTKN